MYFLIFLNILIPILSVVKFCIIDSKVEVNHVFLFSIGYIFYFITPIIVGITNTFDTFSSMINWHLIFDRISSNTLYFYLIMILVLYIAFVFSEQIYNYMKKIYPFNKLKSTKNRIKSVSLSTLKIDKKYLNIFLVVFVFISIYFIFRFKDIFFKGYVSDVSYSLQKGPFIAVSLMIFSLTLIYSLIRKEEQNITIFYKSINNHFMFIFIIISILILSLGGRLYFLSSIMMLFVFRSLVFQKLDLKKFVILLGVLILLMGTIGVWRLDTSNLIEIESVLFNILEETLYTAFSLLSFLEANRFELIQFPIILLSEFLNLIPSFVFPDKLQFMLNFSDLGYTIYQPLGATNVFVSLLIHFGIVGSVMFMFLYGRFFNLLKHKKHELLRTIYIMCSGFLVFSFFRDNSNTSLIKNIFQFSILMPTIMYLFIYLITIFFAKRTKIKQADQ